MLLLKQIRSHPILYTALINKKPATVQENGTVFLPLASTGCIPPALLKPFYPQVGQCLAVSRF